MSDLTFNKNEDQMRQLVDQLRQRLVKVRGPLQDLLELETPEGDSE